MTKVEDEERDLFRIGVSRETVWRPVKRASENSPSPLSEDHLAAGQFGFFITNSKSSRAFNNIEAYVVRFWS